MQHTLEGQRLFPYFAWACVLVGFLAVINLALQAQSIGENLSDRTSAQLNSLEIETEATSL